MAFQSFPGFEPVLEEPRQQSFFLRQGNNAVANVSRRRNVQLLAQTPAGAAVVAYRHNGREIGDEREQPVKRLFARQDYVLLQAVEQRRESRSPTHGYNLQGAHFGGMVGTLHD